MFSPEILLVLFVHAHVIDIFKRLIQSIFYAIVFTANLGPMG